MKLTDRVEIIPCQPEDGYEFVGQRGVIIDEMAGYFRGYYIQLDNRVFQDHRHNNCIWLHRGQLRRLSLLELIAEAAQ